jgi:hypothetical protein
MNSIPLKQNEPKKLDLLAAQRHLYSTAKQIHGWQIILATFFPVFWTFVILKYPTIKAYGALWGVAMGAGDQLIITPWLKRLREKAAKIQELFDCS